MSEESYGYEEEAPRSRTRAGPSSYALAGALVGLVVGFAVAWVVGGNPLSTANEVRYQEVVVNSVSEDADQLCWAEEPERRDSPQTCAILALDPEIPVPERGATVVIGLVELHTPDGSELRQVVHVGSAPAREVEDPG